MISDPQNSIDDIKKSMKCGLSKSELFSGEMTLVILSYSLKTALQGHHACEEVHV